MNWSVPDAAVDEVAVDVAGVRGVAGVERDQDVELDVVLARAAPARPTRGGRWPCRRGRGGSGRATRGGPSRLRPTRNLLLGEELAPLVVQQRAVGLEGVGDRLAVAGELLLELDGLAEELLARQQRLAALPAELGLHRLGRDVLAGVGLQRRRRSS